MRKSYKLSKTKRHRQASIKGIIRISLFITASRKIRNFHSIAAKRDGVLTERRNTHPESRVIHIDETGLSFPHTAKKNV